MIEFLVEKAEAMAIPASAPASEVVQYYGQVGDYIGGVWGTIIGAVTLGLVAWSAFSTHRINEKSKKYQIFSEILRSHEEIVGSLALGKERGREAFRTMLAEFETAYEQVRLVNAESDCVLTLEERIDVAFLFMYYGAHPETVKLLAGRYHMFDSARILQTLINKRRSFKENRIRMAVNEHLESPSKAREVWQERIQTALDIMKSSAAAGVGSGQVIRVLDRSREWLDSSVRKERFTRFVTELVDEIEGASELGGQQSRLSNYFRNLYSAFMFIQESGLSKKEQQALAKVLRSKLSNYEQALLALNSMAKQGTAWRRGDLMARFQPIKNIPRHFFQFDDEFDLERCFPSVTFEWREELALNPWTAPVPLTTEREHLVK